MKKVTLLTDDPFSSLYSEDVRNPSIFVFTDFDTAEQDGGFGVDRNFFLVLVLQLVISYGSWETFREMVSTTLPDDLDRINVQVDGAEEGTWLYPLNKMQQDAIDMLEQRHPYWNKFIAVD
jgi:hypothetical protein